MSTVARTNIIAVTIPPVATPAAAIAILDNITTTFSPSFAATLCATFFKIFGFLPIALNILPVD